MNTVVATVYGNDEVTKVRRCVSFSNTTCVCCGVNFRTAAITLINVDELELTLLVKY